MCCYASMKGIPNLFFTSLPPTLGSEPAAAAVVAAAAVAAGWPGEEGEGPSLTPYCPLNLYSTIPIRRKTFLETFFFYFT